MPSAGTLTLLFFRFAGRPFPPRQTNILGALAFDFHLLTMEKIVAQIERRMGIIQ